jgi:hypothetical protein
MPVLPKAEDTPPPAPTPIRSRSKSFDSPSRIRKTADEEPKPEPVAMDSLQPLRDKSVMDMIKDRKILKSRTTVDIQGNTNTYTQFLIFQPNEERLKRI